MAPSDGKGGAEKPPPTDWGAVYGKLLDAGLRYDEIPKRTLPQIQALLSEWGEIASIKIGMPNIFGGLSEGGTSNNETSSQEDVDSFFNDF